MGCLPPDFDRKMKKKGKRGKNTGTKVAGSASSVGHGSPPDFKRKGKKGKRRKNGLTLGCWQRLVWAMARHQMSREKEKKEKDEKMV